MTRRVMVVFGTRPEAIKFAPIVRAFQDDPRFVVDVVVTGQHPQMATQVLRDFQIEATHNLEAFAPGQRLAQLASKVLVGVDDAITTLHPDVVLVQGDTSSALLAALASFYAQTPVVHVEAGLRTQTILSPFPEEANRRLITRIASLHLAPTEGNRRALVAEGVPDADVVTTGNSVIDALHLAVAHARPQSDPRVDEILRSDRPIVLVTAHRRESWGAPMMGIAHALRTLSERHSDAAFVLPVHANPAVRSIFEEVLHDVPNMILTEPLDYFELASLLARTRLVITDSGGIQEEAPALGVPVIVMRTETERPEGVEAGAVVLVGTEPEAIIAMATKLLTDPDSHRAMATAVNPYGDGHAATRTVAAVAQLLGVGSRAEDFTPGGRS